MEILGSVISLVIGVIGVGAAIFCVSLVIKDKISEKKTAARLKERNVVKTCGTEWDWEHYRKQ